MFNPISPYSSLYKGYFDTRDPYTRNLEEIYLNPLPIPVYGLDELFNDRAVQDQIQLRAINEELESLRRIHDGASRSDTFEHCEQTYAKEESCLLILVQERKAKHLTAALETRDFDAFKYFHFIAARRDQLDTLKEKYRNYNSVCQGLAVRGEANITEICLSAKKDLLDFQSNLEEERKIAILKAYQ